MADISFDYGGVLGAVSESTYLDNGLGESLGGFGGAIYVPLDLPTNTLRTSLSEHWDMDETTGNRAGSLGNYDLAPSGTVSFVTGIISNAADINGAGQLKVTPGSPALDGSLFTCSIWYKPDSATPSAIETIWGITSGTTSTSWWIQHLTDGVVRFRIGDGVSLTDVETGPNALDTSKFNLIVCQYSDTGDLSRIRINDGGWVTNAANTRVMQSATRDLAISGTHSGGQQASGAFDEAAIWPAYISDSNIAWLWNGGAAYAFSNWLPVTSSRRIFIVD